jgi:hypothetical protein
MQAKLNCNSIPTPEENTIFRTWQLTVKNKVPIKYSHRFSSEYLVKPYYVTIAKTSGNDPCGQAAGEITGVFPCVNGLVTLLCVYRYALEEVRKIIIENQ